MKKNNTWFSIIIWMWLVILITLSAYVLLAYMVPFSKNVKWIENASNAYYQASSWIEQALYFVKKDRSVLTTETWSNMPTTAIWNSFFTTSRWTRIPLSWYWNSEFNSWFNQISQSEPIQLEVWNWMISDWWNVKFIFRVPDLNNWASTLSLSWWWTMPVINWILSSQTDSLIASWSYISADNIWKSNCDIWSSPSCSIQLNSSTLWVKLDWTPQDFSNFYWTNCTWTNSCTLKMSVVNDLVLTPSNTQVPYLEYKIDFWTNSVPDRYTRINSSWKSYWFQKDIEVKVPQQTVNQAFDFTVFQ